MSEVVFPIGKQVWYVHAKSGQMCSSVVVGSGNGFYHLADKTHHRKRDLFDIEVDSSTDNTETEFVDIVTASEVSSSEPCEDVSADPQCSVAPAIPLNPWDIWAAQTLFSLHTAKV